MTKKCLDDYKRQIYDTYINSDISILKTAIESIAIPLCNYVICLGIN